MSGAAAAFPFTALSGRDAGGGRAGLSCRGAGLLSRPPLLSAGGTREEEEEEEEGSLAWWTAAWGASFLRPPSLLVSRSLAVAPFSPAATVASFFCRWGEGEDELEEEEDDEEEDEEEAERRAGGDAASLGGGRSLRSLSRSRSRSASLCRLRSLSCSRAASFSRSFSRSLSLSLSPRSFSRGRSLGRSREWERLFLRRCGEGERRDLWVQGRRGTRMNTEHWSGLGRITVLHRR